MNSPQATTSKDAKAVKAHKRSKSKPNPLLEPIDTKAANLNFGFGVGEATEPQTAFRSRAASSPAVLAKTPLPFNLPKDLPSLPEIIQQMRDMESDTDASETSAAEKEKEKGRAKHESSNPYGRTLKKQEPLTAKPGFTMPKPIHPDSAREALTTAMYEDLINCMSPWPELLSPLEDAEYEENMRKAQSVGVAQRSKKGKRSDIDLEDHVLEGK